MLNELIESEAQSWASELQLYNLIFERGTLSHEDRLKLFYFRFMIHAIIRELEELKGRFKVEMEKAKIKNRVVKIWPRPFTKENGDIEYGYFTYEDFIVKGSENLGPQVRSIKVYFNRENIDTSSFIYGGVVLVAKDKMKKPWIYEIKDGKYPYIWIDEIVDFMTNERGENENV